MSRVCYSVSDAPVSLGMSVKQNFRPGEGSMGQSGVLRVDHRLPLGGRTRDGAHLGGTDRRGPDGWDEALEAAKCPRRHHDDLSLGRGRSGQV